MRGSERQREIERDREIVQELLQGVAPRERDRDRDRRPDIDSQSVSHTDRQTKREWGELRMARRRRRGAGCKERE